MKVHLVDGTYELFRHFFAVPAAMDANGQDVGAVRGVLGTVLSMIERGATHIGVATDHVVESFRNDLYAATKRAKACRRRCWRSFRSSRPRFFPWAWSSGRWSSSRRMTPSPRRPPRPRVNPRWTKL